MKVPVDKVFTFIGVKPGKNVRQRPALGGDGAGTEFDVEHRFSVMVILTIDVSPGRIVETRPVTVPVLYRNVKCDGPPFSCVLTS